MNVVELPIDLLKQRARAGDREALQRLRDRGAFPASRLPLACPASWAQQRIWIAAQREQSSQSYVICLARRVAGRLDENALRKAVAALQQRHETLRTRFAERDGTLEQIVDPHESADVTVLDFQGAAEPETACRLRLAEVTREPIDLRTGPLWRVYLCRLSSADHVVGLVVHHIIADAWLLEILQHDLVCLYQQHLHGSPILAPLASQYRHFAAWQRAAHTDQELASSQRYWHEKLADAPACLPLPFDVPPRATDSHAGSTLQRRIDELRLSALRRLAAERGVTLFTILQATVKVLLHRYCHETDIAIGTPVAGRDLPDAEQQIGLFINLLALRDRLDPDAGFDQLLVETARTVEDALAHRKYPFDRLVAEIAGARRGSDAPLFNVLVALQNIAPHAASIADVAVSDFPFGTVFAEYDLAFEFAEHDGELVLTLIYRTARFAAATIERLSRHYERVLEGIVVDPSAAVATLPLLDGQERAALAGLNATGRDYPRERSIAAVFAERAAAHPQARALTWWDGELDYAGLEAQANRLAHHLLAGLGSFAGQPVIAVYLERSPELVVALLAVLKAGAAYLPLDAQEPAERLGFMLSDAGAALVVSTRGLAGQLPAGHPAAVLLDEEAAAIAGQAAEAPACGSDGESLAYVMYTSGSTGQPKGVCVPQRAVLRLAFADYVRVGPGDCIGQAANAAFDALTFEVWGALLNGAAVHVLRREEVLDPARFAEHLRSGRFNKLFLTTALFNRFVQLDPSLFAGLDTLVVGGEAVDAGPVAAVLEHGRPRRLLNGYGPTESTTFATSYEVETVEAGATTIPIGRPLSNTTAHVLDGSGAPVPVGVAGELHLGGDGLALGYLNRPELTAERFIEHPELGRLYRTGDLCRRLADGNLVFLGRVDQQIKLRGFRIEPGEIEACLMRVQGLRQAVVVVQGEGEHRRLVAYVTGQELPDVELLRQRLRRLLPEPMVPSRIVPLAELPLTANGKLDRARLPEPEEVGPAGTTAAATPAEELVASIWCEVLGRESVGREDNFFDLGGHSLLATQLVAAIRGKLWVELPLQVLFANPTLRELAAAIDSHRAGVEAPIERVDRNSPLPLSFAQERLWFLAQLEPNNPFYNTPFALRLSGPLWKAALQAAFAALVARHEVLRTAFVNDDGRPRQVVLADLSIPLTEIDLTHLAPAEREAAVLAHAQAEAVRPFDDLGRPPLLRTTLIRLAPDDHVLLLTMHHIVMDGWSLNVVLREV